MLAISGPPVPRGSIKSRSRTLAALAAFLLLSSCTVDTEAAKKSKAKKVNALLVDTVEGLVQPKAAFFAASSEIVLLAVSTAPGRVHLEKPVLSRMRGHYRGVL